MRRLKYSDFRTGAGHLDGAPARDDRPAPQAAGRVLTLDKLEYNVPLKDEDFTLQALRNPL